nr:aminoglycoside phosphotransferase family protein [Microlunatus antarcticus]
MGGSWTTPSSCLARVRRRVDDTLAIVKVPLVEEERVGSGVLAWWSGDGAALVHAIDDDGAVLIELAEDSDTTLADLARHASPPAWASDQHATRTLVSAARRLHQHPQADPPAGVVPLRRWFRDLFSRAEEVGGFFARAAALADELLEDQRDLRVLHGDIHHGNVLWFGRARGWLAIDPKGLLGESTFDYVNILTNPDRATMLRPHRLIEHATLISEVSGVDRNRLLHWTIAWTGLSAAWYHSEHGLDGFAADMMRVGLQAEQALREST